MAIKRQQHESFCHRSLIEVKPQVKQGLEAKAAAVLDHRGRDDECKDRRAGWVLFSAVR